MLPFIENLKNYPGCKGSSGVTQQIINTIPLHTTRVIPFLGHCAVSRDLRTSDTIILNDIDPVVVDHWKDAFHNSGNYEYVHEYLFLDLVNKSNKIYIYNMDARDLLRTLLVVMDPGWYIYLDPPYPIESRSSKRNIYRFEDTAELQSDIISLINMMKANIGISTYANELYENELHEDDWKLKTFNSRTRTYTATEYLYTNYSPDRVELHDYSYLGNDYRDRERIKLKRERNLIKFKRLPKHEAIALARDIMDIHR